MELCMNLAVEGFALLRSDVLAANLGQQTAFLTEDIRGCPQTLETKAGIVS